MPAEKKIAVIGSNAFSGSDFIDLLLEDKANQVLGISRSSEEETGELFLPYKRHRNPSFQFYQFDLNKHIKEIVKALDAFKPDFIVNFAAQSEVAPSWAAPWDWFETNVTSLSRLCHHLKGAKYLKRYVHISSPEVYGTCHGIKEDAAINPSTPYAVSKAAADMFLQSLFRQYNFPVVFVRSTNVYGAHQQLFKIIPRSVINIKLQKTIELHGGGEAVKSYIHIRDISRGELAVMDKGRPGEIYHLSPEKGIKVKEAVKMICERMCVSFDKATKKVDERPGQDSVYEINSSKARGEFGWAPRVSMEEGISEVIDWVNKNWQAIQKLPLDYIHQP